MTKTAKTPPKSPHPPGLWLFQDAKARFSELVRRVHSEGPQLVTVDGATKSSSFPTKSSVASRAAPRRPDLTTHHDLDSAYRIGLESVALGYISPSSRQNAEPLDPPSTNSGEGQPDKSIEVSRERWRMMGALDSADGMLLFGISTAFIFSVMRAFWPLFLNGRHPHRVFRHPVRGSGPV